MDKAELYNKIADRKIKPADYESYAGGNGRVNRALELYKKGKLKSGGIHIDVGGGIGDLGFALRKEKLFEKTLTIDISAVNLEASRSKGNYVVQADVDKHGFNFSDPMQFGGVQEWTSSDMFIMNSGGRIDAISALDFIEHIIDPGRFASECSFFLKQGGEVFINTPNIEFFEHIQQLAVCGTFPHTSGDTEVFHGGHLAFYTFQDLCMIFDKVGFWNFEQFRDEEGFKQPPDFWINLSKPKNQAQYVERCERLGNSNLLFKAVKK